MSAELRCDKCRTLFVVGPGSPKKVRCPQCGQKHVVPEGIRSLPDVGPARVASDSSGPVGQPGHAGGPEARLERLMPWVISALMHLGVAVVMVFLAMIVLPKDSQVATAGPVDLGWGESVPPAAPLEESDTTVEADQRFPHEMPSAPRPVTEIVAVPSTEGHEAVTLPLTESTDVDLSPRQSGLFETEDPCPGGADQVVFLIDRSGSMAGTFDLVRREMLRNIGRMTPEQEFHVILFAADQPIEGPARRLVKSTRPNKVVAADFLAAVRAEGRTHVLPALKRAFEVLGRSDKAKGRLIYLLTDGVFTENTNEKVLDVIRRFNVDRSVHINTFLYGHRPREAERVMKRIAAENAGRYKYVTMD